MVVALKLSRQQILAYRRRACLIDKRLPPGKRSLHAAAAPGLQDSMPRAALLSIHARVSNIRPNVLEDPALVQVWGPRFNVYVVARQDVAIFTLGRLPERGPRRDRALDMARRLRDLLGESSMTYGEAARCLGEKDANMLRYATLAGTLLLAWDGARLPVIRCTGAPTLDPAGARHELLRRYLALGPGTPDRFARWAGVSRPGAAAVFKALQSSLVPVSTPIGDAFILASDEPAISASSPPVAGIRLLPGGDTFFLLHGADRGLLLPDPKHQNALWTTRVWPGALLVDGEIAGTWRRSRGVVTIEPWRALSRTTREAVEAEAATLPLPDLNGAVEVRW